MKKIVFVFFIAFLNTVLLAQTNQSLANKKATVVSDEVRFTILTPELIRMEWAPDKCFEDQASLIFINRNLEVPKFTVKYNGKWLEIKTDKLKLSYLKGSGKFSAENLNVSFNLNGNAALWNPGLKDTANLKGTARTLDGCKGGFDWKGKPVDLGMGLVSKSGWALIDDSNTQLLDSSNWAWVKQRKDMKRQDWYFFGHGHNYKQALKDYTLVAGKIPLPPKYAFGYWWSRYWVYSDNELKGLIADFRSYDIPIDVLVIDMDWHNTFGGLKEPKNPKMDETGNWLGWTGYSWNKNLFPEPEKFLYWTDKQHLKTALNLHPASGIAPYEDQYNAFASEYGFDTTGQHYIPFKMEEKKWAMAYFNKILRPLEDMGVDFWWLDWQQSPENKTIPGLSNTWWLNYTFFTDMQRRGKNRPLLFHRWGGYGNHRYQVGFSGDDRIDWGSLKYQTYFTSTASNVGYGYWSHDIGGHAASEYSTNPELYVRWLQFGVFSPILRTHCAKNSSIERRFWKYPDHFPIMKEFVQLRYGLAPYIYNAARNTYDSGISICRPMYYDYPENKEAYNYMYQYMFGDNLLVAPIVDSVKSDNQLAMHEIWLPDGKWYDWFSGTLYTGGKILKKNYALCEIPLFAKAGSIIPMYPKVKNLQEPINSIIFNVIPGGDGELTLYEDDNVSDKYKDDKYCTTLVTSKWLSNKKLNMTIFAREGSCDGMPEMRDYEIVLSHSFPPEKVYVNGTVYSYSLEKTGNSWNYNGQSLSAKINIPATKCADRIDIDIVYSDEMIGQEALLNDKIGKFKRLSIVLDKFKLEIARDNWWAIVPDLLLKAEQTPIMIQYNPNKIIPLLKEFESDFVPMEKEILNHKDVRKSEAQKLINYLE